MRFKLHATPVELARYRPEIDGLRAIAILPVVFFHADIQGFSGGYVGVDVFFVISGYLITAIVTRAIAESNFSFARFYERRVRRIFPALFFVLACCTAATLLLLPPGLLVNYGKSLAAVTLFVGNIFFYWTAPGDGYFETRSVVQPLLHAWSLSVEEQFYLLLPIGLVLIHRWARRALKPVLIVGAAISFGLALWCEPVAAFYLLPSRAWELLFGSLLAVGVFPALRNRVLREVTSLAGICMIAAAIAYFDRDTGYSFPYALAPCLGAALIIHASDGGPSWVQRALSLPPLVFIGAISYSLYLWHWPLIFFAKYYEILGLNWQERAGILLAGLVMAVISFYWIEMPFRRPGDTWPRRRIFRWSGVAIGTALASGLALVALRGIPQRFDAETRAIIAANEIYRAQQGTGTGCGHWQDDIQDIAHAARCAFGADKPRKILFWGDSHLEVLQKSIARLYDQGETGGRGVLLAVTPACTPTQKIVLVRPNTNCGKAAHFIMLRAEQSDVDTVFFLFSTWWAVYPRPAFCVMADGACQRSVPSSAEGSRLVLSELAETIATLRSQGKAVIVSLPFPLYNRSIPDLQIHNAMFADTLQPGRYDTEGFREQFRQAVLAGGGIVFDPRQVLCPGNECQYQVGGISLYRDDSHLADGQTEILEPSLAEALSAAAPVSAPGSTTVLPQGASPQSASP
jgi:peptidoglycan/LPS O-acetylase OafA/YrhL